ncbi:MAG: protein translocase subunit SecF [Clostridia bacterium]|nr:protein translocase subunit SecF [Clostridia bacterium]
MNLHKFNDFKKNFQPSKWTKYFLIFSAALIFIGAIMLATLGFNLGMDFTGGNIVKIQSSATISTEQYNVIVNESREILQQQGLTLAQSQIEGESGEQAVTIQYQNKDGVSASEMEEINNAIVASLTTAFPDYTVINAESKSATASTELLTNALIAIVVALVFIMIYIIFRFELLSGVAALITLFHDVLIMCACVLIFRIEINSSFVAAVITILGYSINNTIIVFDRVRENLKLPSLEHLSNKEIADLSIKQTLNRTLNTSITTILAIFLLALIGVPQMTEFVVPILIGLLAGTYAAIFISAPLWATMMSKNSKFGIRQRAKEKAKKIQDEEEVVETSATPVNE